MTTGKLSGLAVLGCVLGIGAALGAAMAGFGTRADWWTYRTGFGVLRWAAWGGLGAAAVSLVGCFAAARPGRSGLALAATGLVAGALSFAVPASGLNKARSVPPIHDITTDTVSPPVFESALEARRQAGARNPASYPGAEVAEQQRRAYPGVRPFDSPLPPEDLFERALTVVREMGWEVLSVDKADGRIEATATTFWFGFRDDVVIRVTRTEDGSRLDMRSVSRVGRSDAGANAARIRRFMAELAES